MTAVNRRTALMLAAGGAAALAGCGRDEGGRNTGSGPGPDSGVAGPSSSPPSPAPSPAPPETPIPVGIARDASPEFRAVADAVVTALRAARIPGAALGILAGKREEHAVFGLASLASMRPVLPDTVFQIGSVTKTYTATAVWRLIEQGTLALDAPVRRYLRGLRLRDEQTAATVTVANLLDHTAGWYGDEIFDTGEDPGALGRYIDNRLPEAPQLFRCGKFFSYNNAAFMLLGRLVETAANTDYNDAMQRLVLGPLGLGATLLDRDPVLRRPYADGHVAMPVNGRDAVVVATPMWIPRCADPAGGLWSTTRDVLRFARLQLGEQPPGRVPFLRPETLRAMQNPAVDVPGLEVKMGRSWFVQEIDGLRVISHDGDTLGQHAVLLIVPERRFALVLLLNGQSGAGAGLAAVDAALSRYPGLGSLTGKAGLVRALLAPTDAAKGPAAPNGAAPRPADYAGRFVDPGQTTTLAMKGSTLEMSSELTPLPGSWQPALSPPPPEPAEVSFLGPDSGVAGGMRIPFVRNDEGDIGWLGEGLRLRPRA